MTRPCLVTDDAYGPRFDVIDGQKIEDFPSLPELAVALIQHEINYALETVANNYQEVAAKQQANGWEKYRAMASRDAIDYLGDLLPEVVDNFDWLFREDKRYEYNAKPRITELLQGLTNQIQTLDDQFGIRYSKEDYCPIWLQPATRYRYVSQAMKYTMKWPDGGSISIITGKTYTSLGANHHSRQAGIEVEVNHIDHGYASDAAYAAEIKKQLDYSSSGRSLIPFYDPPVLDSFMQAVRDWLKHNDSFGTTFWNQQVAFYRRVFLSLLEDLRKADAKLREIESSPSNAQILVESYGKAKLAYAIARLKTEVLLESYVDYFEQVEHYTRGVIIRRDYYPLFIANRVFPTEYDFGLNPGLPATPYDDHPFCKYLQEFDQHVLFSRAEHPNACILYDACFGFTADHSGLQLVFTEDQQGFKYELYDWPEYEDNSASASEHLSLYHFIFDSELSPYQAAKRLPAGLQDMAAKFKDFHL